jgi:diguanylate cyclase (GGDEF)-like protein
MVGVTKDRRLETDSLMSCLEIGKALTSTYNLSEILDLIMSKVTRLIPAENWSLLLKDDLSGKLKFEVVKGLDMKVVRDVRIEMNEGVAGRVAATGESLFIENAKDDERINKSVDQLTGFTTESIICIPLQVHGKVLGVVEIVNVDDFSEFTSKELPVLNILADYAAIAIENSQYFTQIQEMSITDEYTGLYNARHLHQILENLIQQSSESNNKLAVLFVDIDNFKTVVDTHGHLSGSQVLKEIGGTISDCLAGSDTLIKYGGDEYIILLPGKDKKAAFDAAKAILQAIRDEQYLMTEGAGLKLTASFGVAIYPDDAKTKKELLLVADNLMYKVKEKNKNGVGIK